MTLGPAREDNDHWSLDRRVRKEPQCTDSGERMDILRATSSSSPNTGPVRDDFHKLFLLVKDLAYQLDENRQATTKLKLHADLLKVNKNIGSLLLSGRSSCSCID